MEISFRSRKLGKICSKKSGIEKAFGDRARKVILRLSVLRAAENLDDVPKGPPDRMHVLKHNRAGQYAVDIKDNWRLIFIPYHDPLPVDVNKELILKNVTKIQILEIVDYHN